MGNYRGTVRCGVCYEQGHNKRSCPRQTERLQRQFKAYQNIEEINGSQQRTMERIAKELGRRSGVNPLTGEKDVKRGPTRRCSYCKHKLGRHSDDALGHTRRTCSMLKKDKAEAVAFNADYRARILLAMRGAGFGPGALVSVKISDFFPDPASGEERWTRRKVATMLRSIQWDKICWMEEHSEPGVGHRMDKLASPRGVCSVLLPAVVDDEGHPMRFYTNSMERGWKRSVSRFHPGFMTVQEDPDHHAVTLLSGVESERIQPPAGWLDGHSTVIDEHFKRTKL